MRRSDRGEGRLEGESGTSGCPPALAIGFPRGGTCLSGRLSSKVSMSAPNLGNCLQNDLVCTKLHANTDCVHVPHGVPAAR